MVSPCQTVGIIPDTYFNHCLCLEDWVLLFSFIIIIIIKKNKIAN